MHALVLWTETQQISVVPDGDLRGGSNGEAKWGRKFYPVRVLMKSANKKWLDSLHVSLDGTILPPEDHSSKLLEKRMMYQKSEQPSKKTSQESKNKNQALILQSSSIFEASDGEDSPQPMKISSIIDGGKLNLACNNGVPASATSGACSSKKTSSAVKPADEDGSKHNVSQFPGISPEDMATIQSFLAVIKAQKLEKKNEEAVEKKKGANKKGTMTIKKELVPLFEGSTVLLPQFKIDTLVETHKKKPRNLIRKLMLAILGEDTLKESSPTGKGGWNPIPTEIFEDVETFVRLNTKKKFHISHEEYTRCLTAQCATLRGTSKNSDVKDGKIKNKSGFKSSAKTKFKTEKEESSETEESDNDSDSSRTELKSRVKTEKRAAHLEKIPVEPSSINSHQDDCEGKDVTVTNSDERKKTKLSKQTASTSAGSTIADSLSEADSEANEGSASITNNESGVVDGFQEHSGKSIEDEEVIEKVSKSQENDPNILDQNLEDITELELQRKIEELQKLLGEKKKRGNSGDCSQEQKKFKK
ncbi:hypothetical protein QAD02_023638 [Eretmocerus hayati]|uniref:Uncharacterized protein n=2 Tax=Eretmocerus hayati TaxID=131215 RepID=A0ACC2PXJ2_9HYME|nr:hypothetical protein QAD02_023637 [Eretmocerus hayati]KAJ8687843.1 hypothetical protein QAD02_023638 [Eretmocerus hayati]